MQYFHAGVISYFFALITLFRRTFNTDPLLLQQERITTKSISHGFISYIKIVSRVHTTAAASPPIKRDGKIAIKLFLLLISLPPHVLKIISALVNYPLIIIHYNDKNVIKKKENCIFPKIPSIGTAKHL